LIVYVIVTGGILCSGIRRRLLTTLLPHFSCGQCFLFLYALVRRTGIFFTVQAHFVKISLRHAVSVLVLDRRNGTLFLKSTGCGHYLFQGLFNPIYALLYNTPYK